LEHDSAAGALSRKLHKKQREPELQAQIDSTNTAASKMHLSDEANKHSKIYQKQSEDHEWRMNKLKSSYSLTKEHYQI
jgi:hypothetical protein